MEKLNKQDVIARARLRGPDEINPELICCDAIRENIRKYAGLEIEVYPLRVKRTDSYCVYCGTIHKNLTSIRPVKDLDRCNSVRTDMIDFEEGTQC